REERLVCERVFAPDRDAEAVMRENAIPLFSLESHRPACEFAVIGFTLVSEVVYTNLLNMLDLAGLPLRASERDENDPLVFAGGPAVYNPEPLAPFIDLFFIGEAEEDLPRMLTLLHEHSQLSRREKLEMLVREFAGVYVPAFYDENRKPLVDFAPETIQARVIKELKPEYYPAQPVVPLIDVVHDFLNVEVMRGCPHRCRFCMAESIYRPVRPRPAQDIITQITEQLSHSGYGEVTLLSLSVSDYPHIESLVQSLSARLASKRISIDLPSLRPGSVSPELLSAISKVRTGGLTIAPEAGTERLRAFVGKDFPNEAVYDTARLIFANGFRSLKLYFMVGLPTETEDDLTAIAQMANQVRDIGREFDGKRHVTVRLSPFVPEPHTPFQWDQADDEQTMFSKIKLVKSRVRGSNIQVKYHDTRASVLSCALLRGGREMATVIEEAFRLGARFDGWSEEARLDLWEQAFAT
ncbi:MAG: TIGR03960 family B12-binding radical SAM protein, partial [Candidatus Zixiibacteriota bacterium]